MHHHVNHNECMTSITRIISEIVEQIILKGLFWSTIDSKNLTLVNPALSVLSSLL